MRKRGFQEWVQVNTQSIWENTLWTLYVECNVNCFLVVGIANGHGLVRNRSILLLLLVDWSAGVPGPGCERAKLPDSECQGISAMMPMCVGQVGDFKWLPTSGYPVQVTQSALPSGEFGSGERKLRLWQN